MKIFIILVVGLLSGCATKYEVTRCTVIDGIQACSSALIKSRREFPEGMQLRYNSKSGDFEFYADKVDTKESPFEAIGAEFLKKALNQVKFDEP